MSLFEIAGLPPFDALEQGTPEWDTVLFLLEEHAQAFLRVGMVSLRDWAKLTLIERAAFVRAAEKERLLSLAETDPERAARAYAKFDGGAAKRRYLLGEAALEAVKAVRYGT